MRICIFFKNLFKKSNKVALEVNSFSFYQFLNNKFGCIIHTEYLIILHSAAGLPPLARPPVLIFLLDDAYPISDSSSL